MYSESLEPVEWYVVFTAAKIPHWVFKLMHKDYGHVYAVRDLNDYQWLVVQPRINIVDIKIMLKSQYPHIKMITGPDAKVLKVESVFNPRARGTFNWFNCVEQVKALIGVKSFWTWTPKQLHDGLMGNRYG